MENTFADVKNPEGIAEVDSTKRSPIATKVDNSTNNYKFGCENHG